MNDCAKAASPAIGARRGARRLTWGDIDLKKGIVSLDENKTEQPRSWVLSPSMVRVLQAWSDMHLEAEGGDAVFPEVRWEKLAAVAPVDNRVSGTAVAMRKCTEGSRTPRSAAVSRYLVEGALETLDAGNLLALLRHFFLSIRPRMRSIGKRDARRFIAGCLGAELRSMA